MATANQEWPGYNALQAGSGYLDVQAAVNGIIRESTNRGVPVSQMLPSSEDPVAWDNVGWNSVVWNSSTWDD